MTTPLLLFPLCGKCGWTADTMRSELAGIVDTISRATRRRGQAV